MDIGRFAVCTCAICGVALASPWPESNTKEVRDVFIVPHSHCDAGWLQTVQGYYHSRVQSVLTTVTQQLATNPDARFVWAETIWFAMWWPDQPESVRQQFRQALEEGRIEFVGGGWVQNDEVNIPWRDVLEQTTTGHEYLRRELGDIAKVRWGWQLDMFAGYSSVTPTLWSKMGYEGMVIRFEGPGSERARWNVEKAYQFYWEGSASLKDQTRIFTHCLDGNYGDMIEKNLNFDDGAPGLTPSNIETQLEPLLDWLHKETLSYQGPIMALWGSDFQFFNASVMFENMRLAMDWINARSDTLGYRLRLATVSEYMDHLATLKLSFPTLAPTGSLQQDYGNDFEFGWPHAWIMNLTGNVSTQFQTGAPSSRPRHKQRSRAIGAQKRAAETLAAMESLTTGPRASRLNDEKIEDLLGIGREAHGVVQHHDSIPGTMSTYGSYDGWGSYDSTPDKDPCTDRSCMCLEDYTRRLAKACHALDIVTSRSLSVLTHLMNPDDPVSQSPIIMGLAFDARHTEYGDANKTEWGDSDASQVVVFNPLAHRRQSLVRVPIPVSFNGRLPSVVAHATGQALTAQVDVEGRGLYFMVDVRGLSIETYELVDDGGHHTWKPTIVDAIQSIQSRELAVKVNADGLVTAVEDKTEGVTVGVDQSYMEYHNGTGGAYVLIEVEYAKPVAIPTGRTIVGPLFSEIEQRFTDYLYQRVRLVQGCHVVDVQHTVMTLPLGVEVVSRLSTDLATGGKIHTDDSGLELHARPWKSELPLSGNYHALVQAVAIRDESNATATRQLSVMSSHTMGVSTVGADGVIEYMLHRRLNASDDQGPWPLNDTDVLVTDVMWAVGSQRLTEQQRLSRASELEHLVVVGMSRRRPHPLPAPVLTTSQLDASVQVISFYHHDLSSEWRRQDGVAHRNNDGTYVLRLQNIVEVASGGSTVTVNVQDMFKGLCYTDLHARLMTLSLQHELSETVDLTRVELAPIDIATLLVTITPCSATRREQA